MVAETKFILTHTKSTKGTHVYANEEVGLTNIYLPKALPVFQGKDDAPLNLELSLKISK